jgi:hypothetical protein
LFVPQVSLPPHPSSMVPQSNVPQVFFVQVLQTLEVQNRPASQAPLKSPHVSLAPQPSEIVPQLAPLAAHVVGTQGTHLLFVQTWPVGQPLFVVPEPQVYFCPVMQASLTCPHSAPAAMQAAGTLVGQAQLSNPPQPSERVPQVPAGKSVHFFLAQVSQVKVTASQTWPVGQLPQAVVLPQPSGTLPQRPVQDTGAHVSH